MKQLLRGMLWTEKGEKADALTNIEHLQRDRLCHLTGPEEAVLEHALDFYRTSGEAPAIHNVLAHFETANAPPETALIEETTAQPFLTGASFTTAMEEEIELQAQQRLRSNLRTANEILTKGVKQGKETLRGADAAAAFLHSSVQGTPRRKGRKLQANMRQNVKGLTTLYQDRKNSPEQSYGIGTGYGLIDGVTNGIRKGWFYLNAGFGGHLKSTLMLNMLANAAVDGGWNVLLFTTEMPADDLQLMLIAIHSAHPKFADQVRPISSQRLILGALKPEEEDDFETVKADLLTNPDHGSIRVVDTSEFDTLGSIFERTTREDGIEEVDLLAVDYITRLPTEAKYRGLTLTEARNEMLIDSKRFALSFRGGVDQGGGLAFYSPFQVNREGYKHAKANAGRMTATALAQYNAAEKEADAITYVFFDEEEQDSSEPKVGMIKNRWGRCPHEPVGLYIEPDSRRMVDLAAGLATDQHRPTASAQDASDEVTL